MRVAVLGAGRMGKVHSENLRKMKGVTLAAISDAVPEAAAALSAEHGSRAIDMDEVFASPDIDALVVCTPNKTHVDMIERAVEAGKPVFCEKPIDLDYARAAACVEKAEAAGVPLMVGFNRRFDQNFSRARALIEAGELGDVEVVTIVSRDSRPPPHSYVQISGGLFRDQMIHDFDLARYILGDDPVAVHAFGTALIDPQVGVLGDVDTAVVSMETASGRLCQITCSRRSATGGDRRLEILGSKGMLRVENRATGNIEIANEKGFLRDQVLDHMVDRHGLSFFLEMQAFVSALRSAVVPAPSGRDGLKALRLADAATESRERGQRIRV